MSHDGRHGAIYNVLESSFELMTRAYERTLGMAMRWHPATFAVAVAMLCGTYYLFTTMPHGFIPSQDSGFMFAMTMGPQDISFDNMRRHHRAITEIVRAHPEVDTVGIVYHGRQSGGHIRANEASRPARALGGSDHCRSAAESGCGAGLDDFHAESAADSDQRAANGERVSAHVAERQPQRDLSMDTGPS